LDTIQFGNGGMKPDELESFSTKNLPDAENRGYGI